MTSETQVYVGINIQWPISELILDGSKTIETRTYPIPKSYIDKDLVLIETPGNLGRFKSRMRGIVRFPKCFEYQNESEFYADYLRHKVDMSSKWAWDETKPKWGWELEILKVFEIPIPLEKRTGVKYSKDLVIPKGVY